VLHFTIARAAQQLLKKVPFQGEPLPRLPQDVVTTERLNMNRVLDGPVIVAMNGSTSTSLNSWLVPAQGKACYNYV
jgi:hypothetical protein